MMRGRQATRLPSRGPKRLPAARSRSFAVLVALLACTGVQGARAAEHILLSNGFELNCDHRGASAAQASSVRLYLDAAEANYLDVKPEEIVSTELLAPLPELLSAPPAAAVAPAAVASKAELAPAELRELLAGAGAEHDLDVDLLASLVHAESGSHAHALSRAGAQGLMQLMPATAAQLGVRDAFAPEANVHGGTAYLDSLLKRYHDNLALALAAYNAGPGAVDRYHGVPPYRETRAYVARIIHEFNQRYAARQAAASHAASALAMAR